MQDPVLRCKGAAGPCAVRGDPLARALSRGYASYSSPRGRSLPTGVDGSGALQPVVPVMWRGLVSGEPKRDAFCFAVPDPVLSMQDLSHSTGRVAFNCRRGVEMAQQFVSKLQFVPIAQRLATSYLQISPFRKRCPPHLLCRQSSATTNATGSTLSTQVRMLTGGLAHSICGWQEV